MVATAQCDEEELESNYGRWLGAIFAVAVLHSQPSRQLAAMPKSACIFAYRHSAMGKVNKWVLELGAEQRESVALRLRGCRRIGEGHGWGGQDFLRVGFGDRAFERGSC